ncbi:PucR family transcriptional regulator ligand-binding domain-containing protein [Thermoanaerobacterium thermosaccharolyticum]|uniref:PucR family transcriptional regulator n=1 Tax=Thermoanaerobacterium thermosaccharolyticum TaxID=1517 RepID=UPI0027997E71|nr:PucR family transcriptional regulator ligand-binding domain-containing protein [Thermoanaerobacterium thermosaccharolyticum]
MSIKCRDILMLPSLKKFRLVGGKNGLDRNLSWVHVVDVPDVSKWVHGGELLFTTGISIKDNVDILMKIIEEIDSKNLAGLVINVGPYIKNIPKEAISLADRLDFPLFELPWEVKLVDVTEIICNFIIKKSIEEKSIGEFLENILFTDFKSEEVFVSRAEYHGFNISHQNCVMITDIDKFGQYINKSNIKDEKKIMDIKFSLQQIVNNTLEKNGKKPLSLIRGDSVISLISKKEAEDESLVVGIAEEIRKSVMKQMSPLKVSIGIGRYYSNLKDIKNSLKEAERALKLAYKIMGGNSVYSYSEAGIFRLLFEMKDKSEMISFFNELMEPMMKYDESSSAELINTLEVFLQNNGNFVKTAKDLFIHRSTLNYRIKKIEEILNVDLSDWETKFNLQIALAIGKFLKY